MALSYKAKKRWALIILLIGLPVYAIIAVSLMAWLTDIGARPSILVELLIYLVLGLLWALPFKNVFKGVGQADPDA